MKKDKKQVFIYDVAVIGAGAAGCMASIRSGELKNRTILIERNDCIGKKIMLTGKGRCNVTNAGEINAFIDAFGKNGEFYRSVFFKFSNYDLMNFFEKNQVKLKTERQGRVFPSSDQAQSIVDALRKALNDNKTDILFNTRVTGIEKKDNLFDITTADSKNIFSKKVIISTGGLSYSKTGSSGDGFDFAEKLGHTIIDLKPALVPLKTKETWVKSLQGLSLKNVRISFKNENKKIISGIGEMIFTHFGVSGPLILDLSARVVAAIKGNKKISLLIDLKPGMSQQQLSIRLNREFTEKPNLQIKNLMRKLLPAKLIETFLEISGIPFEKKASQVSKKQRNIITGLLKAFPLTITGSLYIDSAMVTNGGISIKEINPRTMESKIIKGLYFAGEIIDGCAYSGGYNLQQSFSTGFVAAQACAENKT